MTLIDDVYVPAHRAGVITSLAAKEGDRLEKNAALAQIDFGQAELEARAARAEREAAKTKAASNVEHRYASITYEVATAELASASEANQKAAQAVSRLELERLKLTADQARLKIESAEHERASRQSEVGIFDARLELAELDVNRRKVISPISGEVAEVCIAAGEWIDQGKPLFRIINLQKLRVESFISIKDRSARELRRLRAHLRIELAHGTSESFIGRVSFVNPVVQPGGFYRVWIEVDNRRDGEEWVLRPGMEAEVKVDE